MAAIVVAFLAIRKTYIALEDFQPEEEERVGLIKENTTGLDIVFKVLSVLTEPAKIDYFPRFSAGESNPPFYPYKYLLSRDNLQDSSLPKNKGRGLTLALSVAVTFLIAFYQSNLRSVIIKPRYRSGINDLVDVEANLQVFYQPTSSETWPMDYYYTEHHTDRLKVNFAVAPSA